MSLSYGNEFRLQVHFRANQTCFYMKGSATQFETLRGTMLMGNGH